MVGGRSVGCFGFLVSPHFTDENDHCNSFHQDFPIPHYNIITSSPPSHHHSYRVTMTITSPSLPHHHHFTAIISPPSKHPSSHYHYRLLLLLLEAQGTRPASHHGATNQPCVPSHEDPLIATSVQVSWGHWVGRWGGRVGD